MDIVTILVNAVPENLLTLLVNQVNVVQHNKLLLVFDRATGLAKCLYIGSVVVDALLLETVDVENIFWIQFPAIIFAYNCI